MAPSTRNILAVFLASPSDLIQERLAARNAIDELNESLRDINWEIELLSWEDTTPGAGRPQAIINRDVDACHVFFGMLWKRWGQSTGEYSSGFEEEFLRALDRKSNSVEPEIMLVFKDVDAATLSDPGEQLKKVIEFKEERISKRDVLFDGFADIDVLKRKLRTWLSRHVYKLNEALRKPYDSEAQPATVAQSTLSSSESDADTISSSEPDPAANQILSAFAAMSAFLDHAQELDIEAAERSQLFTMTVTSTQITGEFAPAHFANLLYLKRENKLLVEAEVKFLFRSLLESRGENIPGWYWVRHWELSKLIEYLASSAQSGSDESVRLQSLNILMELIEPGSDPGWKKSVHEAVLDGSENLKGNALEIIAMHGGIDDLVELDVITDAPAAIQTKISTARLRILIREDKEAALALLLSEDFRIPNEIDKIEVISVLASIEINALFEVLKHPSPILRLAALEELNRKHELTRDMLMNMASTDSDTAMRNRIFHFLVEAASEDQAREILPLLPAPEHWWPIFTLGRDFPEVNRIRSQAYSRLGVKELLNDLDYYSLETPHILRSLGEFFPNEARDPIREMLADEFEKLRESSKRELLLKYDAVTIDPLISPDFLYKNELVMTCLAVLSAIGDSSDASFGRKYVVSEESEIRLEAVYLLERFGDDSDTDLLKEAVETGPLDLPLAAAKALIEVSRDKIAAINFLLTIKKPNIVTLAIASLVKNTDESAEGLVIELLNDKLEDIRLAAVKYLIQTKDDEYLRKLMTQYLGDGQAYFYNVIHWLDKAIYAPETLKIKLRAELSTDFDTKFPDLTHPFH